MTPWLVLLGIVIVVAVLALIGSDRTRGRGCCAPADPAADRRMDDVHDGELPRTDGRGGTRST